jgi:hypothetical protein
MVPKHPAICTIGDPGDPNLVHLAKRARARGFHVIELAETQLGSDWDFEGGTFAAGGEPIQAEEIAGLVVRLKPRQGAQSGSSRADAGPRHRLVQWLDSIRGVVINRPHAGRYSSTEQQQVDLLTRAGFTVPTPLHRYIAGADVRIHTVADQAFATETGSGGVDYGFSAESGTYRPRALPERLAELCCRTAARERLWLAAFDFRVTTAGEWICVGLDRQPDFVRCERSTGQPIADKMVDLFETHLWHTANTREQNVSRSTMLWRSVSVESVKNAGGSTRKAERARPRPITIDAWTPLEGSFA